jgi:hypothetical protein
MPFGMAVIAIDAAWSVIENDIDDGASLDGLKTILRKQRDLFSTMSDIAERPCSARSPIVRISRTWPIARRGRVT